MSGDLSKQDLYEGVKTLVETDKNFIHLPQQKLFTLFSIGFQYLLFQSTRKPGAYIIRVEDGILADKLAKKAKDLSTRRFMQSLLIPRKLKYEKSVFYLDYFHYTSWNLTSDIPKDKVQGALIIKNTSSRPLTEVLSDEELIIQASMPQDQYLTILKEFVPQTLFISHEEDPKSEDCILFPFIKKEKDRTVSGVTINEDIDWED